jgi:tRNA (uracil-5-)-methyltransferase
LPLEYENQFQTKQTRFYEAMAGVKLPEPWLLRSPKAHFRNRAEFRIWRENAGGIALAMHKVDGKGMLPISRCPITHARFDAMLPELLAHLADSPLVESKLFELDFLSSTDGEDMVLTLIYHRPLPEGWHEAATQLSDRFNLSVIGRAKKTKVVIGRDWVKESLEADARLWHYKQVEGGFTQPNGTINRAMIEWVLSQAPSGGDLLELYCGNGNFTLPLSTRFNRTVAIEINKTALAAARENAVENGVADRIFFARMGAEEFARAMAKERSFNRLRDLDLESLDFEAAFVDPPRGGLDETSLALISGMDRIYYVSCNPESLARDLRTLSDTHQVAALALFDQFPYTYHLESGVVLERVAS